MPAALYFKIFGPRTIILIYLAQKDTWYKNFNPPPPKLSKKPEAATSLSYMYLCITVHVFLWYTYRRNVGQSDPWEMFDLSVPVTIGCMFLDDVFRFEFFCDQASVYDINWTQCHLVK